MKAQIIIKDIELERSIFDVIEAKTKTIAREVAEKEVNEEIIYLINERVKKIFQKELRRSLNVYAQRAISNYIEVTLNENN